MYVIDLYDFYFIADDGEHAVAKSLYRILHHLSCRDFGHQHEAEKTEKAEKHHVEFFEPREDAPEAHEASNSPPSCLLSAAAAARTTGM